MKGARQHHPSTPGRAPAPPRRPPRLVAVWRLEAQRRLRAAAAAAACSSNEGSSKRIDGGSEEGRRRPQQNCDDNSAAEGRCCARGGVTPLYFSRPRYQLGSLFQFPTGEGARWLRSFMRDGVGFLCASPFVSLQRRARAARGWVEFAPPIT